MEKYNSKEVADWLCSYDGEGCSDEEFVEVFAYISKMRNTTPVKKDITLDKEDVVNLDIANVTGWIANVLDEVINSEEIDDGAWWKQPEPKKTVTQKDVISGLAKIATTETNDALYEGAMKFAAQILGTTEEKVAELLYDGGEEDE